MIQRRLCIYTSAAGTVPLSTWAEIQRRLSCPIHPQNQAAPLDLIRQRGQLSKLLSGDFEGVMRGLGCAWAALPYSGCGQPQKSVAATMNYFNGALRVYGSGPNINLPAVQLPTGSPIELATVALGLLIVLLLRER